MADQDVVDMTAFEVDFSEIKDLGPVSPGTYNASIVTAKPGMSQTGNPKIDVAWSIVEGEYENRRIFDTLSFHPNALPITKGKLRGIGFPDDFSGGIDPEDLVGVSATLIVTIQKSTAVNPDTGEPYPDRNRISRIIEGDAGDLDMAV